MGLIGKGRRVKKTPVKKTFRKSKSLKRSGNNKSLVRLIKRVTLKESETKYNTNALENQQLFHNGGVGGTYIWLTNLLGTQQGLTQAHRLGDEVIAKGLSIKLWLSNKSDRPNVMYRIFIVAVPVSEVASTSPTGLFKGTSGNKMIDFLDTDKYKVVYTTMVKPFAGDYSLESGASNKEHSTFRKIWIPLKDKKITYSVDNGAVPKYQNQILSLGIIAYDSYGTLTTDNIASCAFISRFYYKDP